MYIENSCRKIPYTVPISPILSSCFRKIMKRGKKTKLSKWKPHLKLLEKINISKSTIYSFFPNRIKVSNFPPNPCLVAYKYLTKKQKNKNHILLIYQSCKQTIRIMLLVIPSKFHSQSVRQSCPSWMVVISHHHFPLMSFVPNNGCCLLHNILFKIHSKKWYRKLQHEFLLHFQM